MRAVIGLCGSLVLLVSCNKGSNVRLPIATSLGNLVRVEKVERVVTDDKPVSAAPGEVLYLLSFEGKNSISAPVNPTLVDEKGNEKLAVFAGSPVRDGTLTKKAWTYNGEAKSVDGKFVFTGTVSLPEPRIAVVFSLPEGSAGWRLKDGENRPQVL